MRRVDHYICEICGTEYADKARCRQCEKAHKAPTEICQAVHKSISVDGTGYPETVDLRMSDGKIVRYKKLRGTVGELR